MRNSRGVDRPFLWLTALLVFAGLFIFTSASLGIHAREGLSFARVAFNQLVLGLVLGTVAMLVTTRIPYKFWNKYGFYIFILSALFTLAVFIPGLGLAHGGAQRWISIGSLSFQPAEFLKLGFVMYIAALLSSRKTELRTFKEGALPLIAVLAIVGAILLAQPDTGTFFVIALAGIAMFFVAGGKWSHIGIMGLIGAGGVGLLALFRPYVLTRITTFFNPAFDPTGASYQIQQSLIAIGSGEVFGRGLGQSIQKFNFLPEPVGDSIFAVFAEEWGFVGGLLLIALFVAFMLRGFRIAAKAPNLYSRLLVTGILVLIVGQSFVNIASMLGIFPLTGMPLIFISQGGTALMMALASVGIILSVSRGRQ